MKRHTPVTIAETKKIEAPENPLKIGKTAKMGQKWIVKWGAGGFLAGEIVGKYFDPKKSGMIYCMRSERGLSEIPRRDLLSQIH